MIRKLKYKTIYKEVMRMLYINKGTYRERMYKEILGENWKLSEAEWLTTFIVAGNCSKELTNKLNIPTELSREDIERIYDVWEMFVKTDKETIDYAQKIINILPNIFRKSNFGYKCKQTYFELDITEQQSRYLLNFVKAIIFDYYVKN